MNIKRKRLKNLIILCGVLILLLLIIGLLSNKLVGIDKLVYELIIKLKSPFMTKFFKFITFFASIWWFFIVCVLLLIFNKNRKLSLVLIVYIFIVAGITFFMKNIFGRARPNDLVMILESGYSFPSGHSSSSMAFYGFLAYLVYKSNLLKYKKIILVTLLLSLVLLIGMSRIYLGVHYATDVLAGFMVGLIYLMIFILLYNMKKEEKDGKSNFS